MNCRFCDAKLKNIFVNLGKSPMANSFLSKQNLNNNEAYYPLCVYVCSKCFLVQLDEFENPKDIFSDYAYFSSFSETWVNHVKKFVEDTIVRFKIKKDNFVTEIASNDGYLLQFFRDKEIPILGIEPASNIAKKANENGIITINKFFGENTAKEIIEEKKKADLIIAFNVLPHVPNLIDFVKGLKILLETNGIIVIQFSAYILQLIKKIEFDVIYHEHFSYFSLYTLQKIFSKYRLTIFDIEEVSIHGGSLRIFAKHVENQSVQISQNVSLQISKEEEFGLTKITTYEDFQKFVNKRKMDIREFFIQIKKEKKSIVGYGAPAKGNTLLNYCEIGTDFIEYTVDINPHKQGLHLPGTKIPILAPEKIFETKPDYIVILAWNLKEEIMEQMKKIREWNGKFVILIPEVTIL